MSGKNKAKLWTVVVGTIGIGVGLVLLVAILQQLNQRDHKDTAILVIAVAAAIAWLSARHAKNNGFVVFIAALGLVGICLQLLIPGLHVSSETFQLQIQAILQTFGIQP